jgi:hypothetical protein
MNLIRSPAGQNRTCLGTPHLDPASRTTSNVLYLSYSVGRYAFACGCRRVGVLPGRKSGSCSIAFSSRSCLSARTSLVPRALTWPVAVLTTR